MPKGWGTSGITPLPKKRLAGDQTTLPRFEVAWGVPLPEKSEKFFADPPTEKLLRLGGDPLSILEKIDLPPYRKKIFGGGVYPLATNQDLWHVC